MKPRTFGDVFGQVVGLEIVLFVLYYLWAHDRWSDHDMHALMFGSLLGGIAGAYMAASMYKGGFIVMECDDPKKTLTALAVHLAEMGYNLETQTESLHTFKPPFVHWFGGRFYIISEGLTLRIVGPKMMVMGISFKWKKGTEK